MATSHTKCHDSVGVCVCVCRVSQLHVLSQESIQESLRGEVTWPKIGQIECITSGLWVVFFFYLYLKQSLIFF